VVSCVGIYLWGRERECRHRQEAFDHRLEEIRSKTEELKIGATIGEIDFFFRRNGIHYVVQDASSSLVAPREGKLVIGSVALPMCGGLSCDDYALIQILVRIDGYGRLVTKDVSAGQTCLDFLSERRVPILRERSKRRLGGDVARSALHAYHLSACANA
jgi:hypothetical protein